MEKIALGVCSSISVYKACEVIRGFQKAGFQVQVIMTKNATRLVQPLLFGALTNLDVLVDPFDASNMSQDSPCGGSQDSSSSRGGPRNGKHHR